jgi:hypothetical protein
MALTDSANAYDVLAFYIALTNNLEQPRNARGKFLQKSVLFIIHGFNTDYLYSFNQITVRQHEAGEF